MTAAPGSSIRQLSVRVLTGLCGLMMGVLGSWSLLAPASFARFIDFSPFNEHLLHDVGAFQIGIGITLLLSTVWKDPLGVALVGFVSADALHVANHALDLHLGGHRSDPWLLGGFGLLALTALVLHLRPVSPAQRNP